MKPVSRRLREQAGYSLVEVLAAIVLLSLAILPMVSMFDAGLEAASTGGNYDKARALASSNLEAIKADLDEIKPDTEFPCPVTDEAPLDDCDVVTEEASVGFDSDDSSEFGSGEDLSLTKVRVTVEWDDGKEYVAAGVIAGEDSE